MHRNIVNGISFLVSAVVTFAAGCSPPAATPPSKTRNAGGVEIEVVSVEAALAQIASQKGKIVVVDTWATWCPPCVAEFPELVQIHQKYAQNGVTAMSVSVDKVSDRDKALKFLKSKDAAFPNFLVEDGEKWGDHWKIKGIPIVLVFDRDGKMIRRFDRDDPDKQFEYSDVDKFVGELVAEKK